MKPISPYHGNILPKMIDLVIALWLISMLFRICQMFTANFNGSNRSLKIDPRFNTGIILFFLREGLLEPRNRPTWEIDRSTLQSL
ncbi:hypothetical protein BDV32DRAFT_116232, partial [Aspergillus pseudonomiae]